jgi:hypothetical protein
MDNIRVLNITYLLENIGDFSTKMYTLEEILIQFSMGVTCSIIKLLSEERDKTDIPLLCA